VPEAHAGSIDPCNEISEISVGRNIDETLIEVRRVSRVVKLIIPENGISLTNDLGRRRSGVYHLSKLNVVAVKDDPISIALFLPVPNNERKLKSRPAIEILRQVFALTDASQIVVCPIDGNYHRVSETHFDFSMVTTFQRASFDPPLNGEVAKDRRHPPGDKGEMDFRINRRERNSSLDFRTRATLSEREIRKILKPPLVGNVVHNTVPAAGSSYNIVRQVYKVANIGEPINHPSPWHQFPQSSWGYIDAIGKAIG
jgi:hypothetical protein